MTIETEQLRRISEMFQAMQTSQVASSNSVDIPQAQILSVLQNLTDVLQQLVDHLRNGQAPSAPAPAGSMGSDSVMSSVGSDSEAAPSAVLNNDSVMDDDSVSALPLQDSEPWQRESGGGDGGDGGGGGGDPLAFDLNRDGQIGVTGQSGAQYRIDDEVGRTVTFDLDGDGRTEQIEWMAGDGDGLLVDTTQINGNQIDGRALFGDEGGRYAHGLEKLTAHDDNADGSITGDELDGLAMWVDDGDGVLEDGELKSLEEVGIYEVSTDLNLVENDRGETLMRSTANEGQMMTEDVWFKGENG